MCIANPKLIVRYMTALSTNMLTNMLANGPRKFLCVLGKGTTSSNTFAPTNHSSLRKKIEKRYNKGFLLYNCGKIKRLCMYLMQVEKIRLDQLLDSIICLWVVVAIALVIPKTKLLPLILMDPSARFKRRVVVAVLYSLRSYKRFPNQTMIRIDKFVANTAVLTKQAFTLSCLYSAWA